MATVSDAGGDRLGDKVGDRNRLGEYKVGDKGDKLGDRVGDKEVAGVEGFAK